MKCLSTKTDQSALQITEASIVAVVEVAAEVAAEVLVVTSVPLLMGNLATGHSRERGGHEWYCHVHKTDILNPRVEVKSSSPNDNRAKVIKKTCDANDFC